MNEQCEVCGSDEVAIMTCGRPLCLDCLGEYDIPVGTISVEDEEAPEKTEESS